MANEGDGWSGSGANPWHLDANTGSILFLTDESNKPARIGFSVTVAPVSSPATGGGTTPPQAAVHYYLTSLQLAPFETRAINIRQLRDAQIADFKGHKIPLDASDGAVNWVRMDDVPMTGRLLVIRKGQGTASSYDCCTCPCPASYTSLTVDPGSYTALPGDNWSCAAEALYTECNQGGFYSDVTDEATWSSSDTSVATVDNLGNATAVAGGSADIQAYWGDYSWAYDSYHQTCISNYMPCSASSPTNVVTVTIQTQSNSNNFVFVGTNDNTVTTYNTQLAVGIPDGGSYSWSVSPESVTIAPNNSTSAYLPTFTGSTPSGSVGSTTEKVTYTLNSQSGSDSRAITLREFNALATPSTESGCPDYPNAPPPGQGYLEEFVYNILTTPGAQQVQSGFPDMTVTETSNVTSVTPSNYQFTPQTGKAGTGDSSQIEDCLGIPSSTTLPSNLVVCESQTISVGGIQVRANTVKYTNTGVSIVSTCP